MRPSFSKSEFSMAILIQEKSSMFRFQQKSSVYNSSLCCGWSYYGRYYMRGP